VRKSDDIMPSSSISPLLAQCFTATPLLLGETCRAPRWRPKATLFNDSLSQANGPLEESEQVLLVPTEPVSVDTSSAAMVQLRPKAFLRLCEKVRCGSPCSQLAISTGPALTSV